MNVWLCNGVGRKPLIDAASQEVIVDVLVRKDRANNGVGVSGAIDVLEEMHPDLTLPQLLLRQNQTRCFQVDQERDLRTVFAILWCVTQGVEPKAVAHIWLAGTDHRSTSCSHQRSRCCRRCSLDGHCH